KPKTRNIRKKVTVDDEDADSISDQSLLLSTATTTTTPATPATLTKKTKKLKSHVKLSFGIEEEALGFSEDEGGEVYVSKVQANRRTPGTKPRKLYLDVRSLPKNLESGTEAPTYTKEILSQLKESTPNTPPSFTEDALVAEKFPSTIGTGPITGIPDPATIHAAKKKREMLRQRAVSGAPEYISLSDETDVISTSGKKLESRLVREEDEADDVDAATEVSQLLLEKSEEEVLKLKINDPFRKNQKTVEEALEWKIKTKSREYLETLQNRQDADLKCMFVILRVELNSKLLAEISELRKEYAKIPELRKKYAEIEAGNVKLRQVIEESIELKTRFEELEKNNKTDTAKLTAENTELKDRITKLEQKQTQVITNELRASSTTKSESLTELEESEIRCSALPPATSLPQDDTSKQMSEDASDISDIASNTKSLEDKAIDEFLDGVHKKRHLADLAEWNNEYDIASQEYLQLKALHPNPTKNVTKVGSRNANQMPADGGSSIIIHNSTLSRNSSGNSLEIGSIAKSFVDEMTPQQQMPQQQMLFSSFFVALAIRMKVTKQQTVMGLIQ
ncbi:2224_t:CDS:10, partial [Paraglomus occultum]